MAVTRNPDVARPGHGVSGPEPGRAADRHWLVTVSTAVTLVAIAVGSFALHLLVVGPVLQARAQQVLYADFRIALSEATAPTGQLTRDGELLPLGTPVALLSSADLGLDREVVLEGTTGGVLAQGPGHRRSSVLPGQAGVCVIYGRAWSSGAPFGGLGELPVGSEIVLTSGQGEHTYRVTGVRRAGAVLPVPPDATAGEGRLTLVSAEGLPYVGGSVVYVDAALTTPAAPSPGLAFSSAALPESEDAYGSDPQAWVPVTLHLLGVAAASLATGWLAVRWGRRQAWLAGFPVLVLLTTLASRELVRLLPNLL
jgi:sortase A